MRSFHRQFQSVGAANLRNSTVVIGEQRTGVKARGVLQQVEWPRNSGNSSSRSAQLQQHD